MNDQLRFAIVTSEGLCLGEPATFDNLKGMQQPAVNMTAVDIVTCIHENQVDMWGKRIVSQRTMCMVETARKETPGLLERVALVINDAKWYSVWDLGWYAKMQKEIENA